MSTVDTVDWERAVFALVAPDALARGLGPAALDRFAAAGFVPVAGRVLWTRPADLDAFHERNITEVWKAYLYRLVDLLFDYGPSVALLLADESSRPGSSHERLRRIKGASDPNDALPGTIRADLRSINAMLALVHTSDTPADSRAECEVFLGDGPWSADTAGAGLRELVGLVGAGVAAETREFDQVLAGVRARLAGAVWDDLTAEGRAVARSWQAGGVAEIAAVGAGARLAGLLREPDRHPLAPLLRAEFSPDRPAPDLARTGHLLRAHGVRIDRWEHLVLTTSARFRPLRMVGREP